VLNAAVLGSPIAHSLSPVLHRAAYRALGLDQWRYAAHEVDEAAFLPFVADLDETWRGLSLTMPLKEVAFEAATDISPTALATGAINTLVRRDTGEWDAHNTDVHGIRESLREAAHDGSATVLGSGATARSALLALHGLGVQRVRLAVRGEARPDTLRAAADLGLALEAVPLGQWCGSGGLVVSTLPAAASESAAAAIGSRQLEGVLLDVVYASWPTALAAASAGAGLVVVSGVDMLVHQAAEQVRLMTGQVPPLEAMLTAGREALDS
jgi:shikimate dehydrogenase